MSSSIPSPNKIISIGSSPQTAYKGIVGQSPSMKKIFRIVEKVAASDTTIILNGETGTGKGMIARAIHECSPRRSKPLIQINCGATPEGLLESEFFGYRRGAFTGAVADKPGKFEMANGGTIFLEEIGDMSTDLQVKVLRVLEEGELERVGGRETIKVDARIIAATHRDLEEEVQKGHFREDLFYRHYVIPILLPALRERKGDIPFLVYHFLSEGDLSQSRVGHRYHLHPPSRGLAVPGRHSGLVLALCGQLGTRPDAGDAVRAERRRPCPGAGPTLDLEQ